MHEARHSLITLLQTEGGADLATAAKLADHSSTKTTARDSHTNTRDFEVASAALAKLSAALVPTTEETEGA